MHEGERRGVSVPWRPLIKICTCQKFTTAR